MKTITDAQYEVFRKEMKRRRKDAGLSAADFGKYMSVSTSHIYNIENGQRKPPMHFVENVAKKFGVDAREMFMSEDDRIREERIEYGKSLSRRRIAKDIPLASLARAISTEVYIYREIEQGLTSIQDRDKDVLEKILGSEHQGVDKEDIKADEVPIPPEISSQDNVLIPAEIVATIIAHVTELQISKEEQKKIFRFFSELQLKETERKLFGEPQS